MAFFKIRNLDRDVDEHINTDFIARLRDIQSRDQNRCTMTFSSGDTMTVGGTADEVLTEILSHSQ